MADELAMLISNCTTSRR